MSLFEKRPFSIILCILLGGFSLFVFVPKNLRLFVLATTFILLIVFLILRKKIGLLPFASAITLLISFALSLLYFEQYFPIYNRVTGPAVIKGTVTDVIYKESFGARVTVKTQRINNLPFSSSKILLSFVPEDDTDLDFDVSDSVLVYGEILEFESAEFGFDEKSYYESHGLQGVVKDPSVVSFTKNSCFSLRRWIFSIREAVSDYILKSSDESASGLLAALILGDKSALPGQMALDFNRIGLSHILAISGMHLAILAAGLHKILSLLGVNKKWRVFLSMLFVLAYMGLTGFPVSILRAGGMVLIANLLFLLAKTQDSLTNLMIAMTVICIISPYAVRNTSLLLSFFATLGVLVAVRWLDSVPYHIPRWRKILIAIISSFLSSFFAIAMTLPFSVFEFGRISYITPITTLLFSLLVEIFMYVGSIFLLIGAPGFLSAPIAWFASFLSDLAAWFADISNIYIIVDTYFIKILCILFYVFLLLFLILRIKHRKIALSLLLIPFLSIFLCGYISTTEVLQNDRIVYISDTKKNDAILAIQNGTVTLANFTDNSANSCNYLLYQLEQEDILSVDHLWIPQFTANLPRSLSVILSSIPIRHIYLPMPTNEMEDEIYRNTEEILSDFRCVCNLYEISKAIPIQDMKLYPAYRSQMEDGCRVILSFGIQGQYYTYISNGAIEERNTDLANYIMTVSNTVIFGCRGRSYRDTYYLEEASPYTQTMIFGSDQIEIDQNIFEKHKDRIRFLYKPKRVTIATDSIPN